MLDLWALLYSAAVGLNICLIERATALEDETIPTSLESSLRILRHNFLTPMQVPFRNDAPSETGRSPLLERSANGT